MEEENIMKVKKKSKKMYKPNRINFSKEWSKWKIKIPT